MAYASPQDVDDERTPDDPEWADEKVQKLLDDAEDLVKLSRDLPARVRAGRTTEGLIRRVILEMVLDILHNPHRLSSVSDSQIAGPYTLTASRSFGASATGGLHLTREQRKLLGDKVGGIRTVAPGLGHRPLPWGC